MSLDPEQALDESTYRSVEGSFDDLRIAARHIREGAEKIRSEGGEARLSELLDATADQLAEMLKELMNKAYFPAPTEKELEALARWKQTLPGAGTKTGGSEDNPQTALPLE